MLSIDSSKSFPSSEISNVEISSISVHNSPINLHENSVYVESLEKKKDLATKILNSNENKKPKYKYTNAYFS